MFFLQTIYCFSSSPEEASYKLSAHAYREAHEKEGSWNTGRGSGKYQWYRSICCIVVDNKKIKSDVHICWRLKDSHGKRKTLLYNVQNMYLLTLNIWKESIYWIQ